VPIGYCWHREAGLGLDPDLRVQEVVRLIFARFEALGSARQVLLSLAAEHVHFPSPSDGKKLTALEWRPIRYRAVIGVLKNPFYAGAYVYGKSEKRTAIVEGRARKSYGHGKPQDRWEVLLKAHHDGYIDWSAYERNQAQLARNAYRTPDGAKSGRGGRALLAGLLACACCGRRLLVSYSGRPPGQTVYRCDRPNQMLGLPRCMTFGGTRVDAAVAAELRRALEPMAIEAALEAERILMETTSERRRIAELELQQARYEAKLAERRYAACDPDHRLIAAQLERNWEAALQRVAACDARLVTQDASGPILQAADLAALASDLNAAWNAPGVATRTRQRLVRSLITDIVADVDEATREVVLVIHWKGGQHSELRVRKPKSGEHGCRTPEEALAVMRTMATRWSDEQIAASLNRMGMSTGQGKTWTAHRVSSLRRVHGIRAYRSADKDGDWLTMSEAATRLDVTNHRIRRLIKVGVLAAEQVVPGAPYQIRAFDLQTTAVTAAIGRTGRPCRADLEHQLPMFPTT
jgi:Recombinase